MSQPDEFLPESAWNFVSLAEIAAKSQEDWEAETKQPYLDEAMAILDSLFGGLPVIEGASFTLRILIALVRRLTGNADLVFDTVEAALEGLNTLVGTVITDIGTDVQAFRNAIAHALGHTGAEPYSNDDILGFLGTDVVTAIGTAYSNLADLITKLLRGGIAINSGNLFGMIASDLVPQVGIGSISGVQPNLIVNPGFMGAISMDGQGLWTWDNTEDHTGIEGSGSAKIVCDGAVKHLLSNPGRPIAVSENDQMSFGCWVKWKDLVRTGSPIRLDVRSYLNGTLVTDTNVAVANVNVATHDWTYISGFYTVPAGVDAVRAKPNVTTASSGTVYFDDVEARKTGLLGQALIAGLVEALAGLVDLITFKALRDAIAGAVDAEISDVETRLNSFLTALSTLDASKIVGEVTDAFVFTPFNNMMALIGQALSGIIGIFTNNQIFSMFAAQTSALIGLQTQINTLNNTIYTTGNYDGDDFERTGTDLGAGWLQYFSTGGGSWGTNGHDAYWIKSGSGDRDVLCIRNAGQVHSLTNNQRVTVVLATGIELDTILGIWGHIDCWLRVSDATTSISDVTGIRVRLSGDGSASIDRFVSGSRTLLLRIYNIDHTGGVSFSGEAGKPGVARYFRGLLNGSPIPGFEIAEVGTTSGLGDGFKRWGHGARAEGNPLHDILSSAHQCAPPAIRQVTMSDI